MNYSIIDNGRDCRLIFSGSLTQRFLPELETAIIGTMRRYPRMQVDLSSVREIDRYGIHVLTQMRRMGGKEVDIVATSALLDQLSPRGRQSPVTSTAC